jgi:hypothetical protein
MLTKAGARHLRLVCIVAPEGVAPSSAYPSVPIFTPVAHLVERASSHQGL